VTAPISRPTSVSQDPNRHQQQQFPRAQSDSMLRLKKSPGGIAAVTTTLEGDEERGVHGGEYSVRPNMQESMVFLRKLFTHQHEGGGTVPGNLFSPPDAPMLPGKSAPSTDTIDSPKAKSRMQVGVCTIRARSTRDPLSQRMIRYLAEIRVTCLHNAAVADKYGLTGKKQSWELLAKAVEASSGTRSAVDGWGGRSGARALSVGLVINLLKYYESLGDVQMLSTIVCVLRTPSSPPGDSVSCTYNLLPTDQDDKYDAYIRRYADLLYGWGLLTKRAELNKHLVRSLTAESYAARRGDMAGAAVFNPRDPKGDDVSSLATIGYNVTCPRCSKDTTTSAASAINFWCRNCRDYAFRCVICDTAVRGLFAFCECCKHGGHTAHLKEWFTTHETCPSGCGCRCAAKSLVTPAHASTATTSIAACSVDPPPHTLSSGGANPDSVEVYIHS